MANTRDGAPWGLRIAAIGGLLFLHVPMALILLYAFTTEERSYQFPPPGYTLRWFAVVWERQDIWDAMWLSAKVAAAARVPKISARNVAIAATSSER